MTTYGLIGRSLAHSSSPAYFNKKFQELGLEDHRYELFELAQVEDLTKLLEQRPDITGLNVTIPYKESVLPLLDRVDPVAAEVGAVNTIVFTPQGTVGHNTDVIGLRQALQALLLDARPERALVLGSGGAAKAVWFVLREFGIPYSVVSRSQERGDLTWSAVDAEVIAAHKLIINTTPVGMAPEVEAAPPLPYAAMGTGHFLLDLIYNPADTQFIARGKVFGALCMNGEGMLRVQAEAAWQLWQAGR